MSTPRVGSSMISTRGLVSSHLASATGIARVSDARRLPADHQLLDALGAQSAQRLAHLGATGADQAGETQDLAFVNFERNVAHLARHVQPADVKRHLEPMRLAQR